MRVLRLGNSQDLNSLVPELQRSWRIAERMLQEAAGERVETVLKPILMSAQVPDIVDGWMVRYCPEVVVLIASGIWYTYDSSLLKLIRAARFLRPAVSNWQKLALNDWFAGDHLHWTEAGHAREAERDTKAMLEAWQRVPKAAAR